MRRYYIDNIRWMSVMLVVIYHVVYLFNGVAAAGVVGPFRDVQYQDAVQYILYPWFMVLLFIISGICARYYLDKHSDREFLQARTRKLLIPSTLGLFAFHWMQGYVNMYLSGAFDTFPADMPKPAVYLIMVASGVGVLWFIQMLWIFSALLVLLRRIEKGRIAGFAERLKINVVGLIALGIIVWGAAQILNTPVIAVYRFGIYGLVFFLGYYLFSQERVTDILAKYCWFFSLAAIILSAVSVAVYFGQNYAVSPVVNSPLSVAYSWMTCLAMIGLVKRYGDKTGAFADYMNRKSWGLYLFHYLPLSVCGLLLTRFTTLPVLCIYILTGIAAFAGAVFLYEVVSRIPILRFLVLGISGKKRKDANV